MISANSDSDFKVGGVGGRAPRALLWLCALFLVVVTSVRPASAQFITSYAPYKYTPYVSVVTLDEGGNLLEALTADVTCPPVYVDDADTELVAAISIQQCNSVNAHDYAWSRASEFVCSSATPGEAACILRGTRTASGVTTTVYGSLSMQFQEKRANYFDSEHIETYPIQYVIVMSCAALMFAAGWSNGMKT